MWRRGRRRKRGRRRREKLLMVLTRGVEGDRAREGRMTGGRRKREVNKRGRLLARLTRQLCSAAQGLDMTD